MSYIVKKKNRVLRIPEEKAEEYAKMGYEVTDENGEVIMNAVVTSVAEAQRAVNKLQKENEELKAKGYTTVGGRVSRQYYYEKIYGAEKEKADARV